MLGVREHIQPVFDEKGVYAMKTWKMWLTLHVHVPDTDILVPYGGGTTQAVRDKWTEYTALAAEKARLHLEKWVWWDHKCGVLGCDGNAVQVNVMDGIQNMGTVVCEETGCNEKPMSVRMPSTFCVVSLCS